MPIPIFSIWEESRAITNTLGAWNLIVDRTGLTWTYQQYIPGFSLVTF